MGSIWITVKPAVSGWMDYETERWISDLKHAVLATLLFGEDIEGLLRVARGNDAVRDFSRDDASGGEVARGG